jgi:hypothetical protein
MGQSHYKRASVSDFRLKGLAIIIKPDIWEVLPHHFMHPSFTNSPHSMYPSFTDSPTVGKGWMERCHSTVGGVGKGWVH